MADNRSILNDDTTDKGTLALDEVTYSGDTALVGVNRLVHVSGSEGSKTVSEILFAEDAAHTTGDYGFQILAVRNDTLAALAGTDGDYTPLQVSADGALYCSTSLTGNLPDTAAGDLAAMVVDLAAIETLITASNVDLAAIEVLITAGNVDLAAMEVLLTTIDADTDAIKTAVETAIDNTTDTITASLDTAAISNDGTLLTPKFAAVNATVNGDNTIVAAVAGKKLRVLAYALVADAAVGVAFEDGAGGTELSGQMAFAANGGISIPFNPVGWFETTANTLLNIETDAAANVRGHLVYVEV